MAKRVFLVEDNPIIRESLTEAIEDLSAACVVGWAATEQDACEHLNRLSEAWDVALVDLFLLQGSGLGVVRQLRGRAAHQKVYVVSNYATNDIRDRAARLGADAVFDKSTELDALIDHLAAPS